MNFSCSQCSFIAQFETGLAMHHQLHHESPDVEDYMDLKARERSITMPRPSLSPLYRKKDKYLGLGRSTSSATRLFGKIRDRICRSKTLFPHPEERPDRVLNINELSATSECTSKAMEDANYSRLTSSMRDLKEIPYGCHMCDFEADRITALDRHLLNDHKIGIENLLKLVMAKTQEGLVDEQIPGIYGGRQTYYRPPDQLMEEGEFVIETVTPKIKILKHASANTDLQWCDIPNLKDNCRIITSELDKLMKHPMEKTDKEQLFDKMNTLNEVMCKFVDSSNTLKKVLTKEFHNKGKEQLDDTIFELGLGDRETPRHWDRAHSEKLVRTRNTSKYGDHSRCGEKSKLSAESYYF